jgi:hypothetical protein
MGPTKSPLLSLNQQLFGAIDPRSFAQMSAGQASAAVEQAVRMKRLSDMRYLEATLRVEADDKAGQS